MSFDAVLHDLLARNDRAAGALFLDAGGETVGYACAAITPYELRVLGAYLGIYLRQLDRLFAGYELGEPRLIASGYGLPFLLHYGRGGDNRAATVVVAPLGGPDTMGITAAGGF